MLQELFINFTILITFITLSNHFFKYRNFDQNSLLRYKIIYGILNGLLGCIIMLYSVEIYASTIIDFRNVAIILAVMMGGFISSIIATLLIGCFRIFYFGYSISSITAFITILIVSIVCSIIARKVKSIKLKWTYCTLFGIIAWSIALIYLIEDNELLMKTLLLYIVGTIIVMIIIYYYIASLITTNQLFKKYKEQAIRDYLTGLYNVRQFDKYYNQLSKIVAEENKKLSILLIDIDYFKKVNDTYGHTEGDLVLKELSELFIKCCRHDDIVSRNGGEEFSVLLNNCDKHNAYQIADRILTTVEKHQFVLSNGEPIHITISIGIATYPTTTTNINKLIEEADKALYEAKQNGRNQIVLT